MIPHLVRVIPTVNPPTGKHGLDFVFATPATEHHTTHLHTWLPRRVNA